jgi:hypothetical protein
MTVPVQGQSRKRLVIAVLSLGLLGLCAWLLFGHRESPSERWMAERRAQGEKFTVEELGLDRPASTNAVMEIIELAASRLKALERARVAVPYQSSEPVGSSAKRVDWAETNLHSVMARVLDWGKLGVDVAELRPTLAAVQEAIRKAPHDSGRDYVTFGRRINLVAIREVAQSLHDV